MLEKGMMLGNHKQAYNILKALANTEQHIKLAAIEDSSGNILTESTAVLNRWKEYLKWFIQLRTPSRH